MGATLGTRGRSGGALLGSWRGSVGPLPGKPWPLLSYSADSQSCLPASPLAGREDFRPRVGSHEGTGYKSNYRPVVSYQPSLDALDNPAMGYGLSDSCSSPALRGLSPQGHRTSSDPLQAPGMGSEAPGNSGCGAQPSAQRQADSRGSCGRFEGGGKFLEISLAASRGQRQVALGVIAPASVPPPETKSATISRL